MEATGTGQVAGREGVVAPRLLPGEGTRSAFMVSPRTRRCVWGLRGRVVINSPPLDEGLSRIGGFLWKGVHFEIILKEP